MIFTRADFVELCVETSALRRWCFSSSWVAYGHFDITCFGAVCLFSAVAAASTAAPARKRGGSESEQASKNATSNDPFFSAHWSISTTALAGAS